MIAVLAAAELESAGHTTQVSFTVAATADEYVPTPQSVHAALSLVGLYVPGTHAEHPPPSAPVNPALHTQAVMAQLELGEFEFAVQATHTAILLAPSVTEYVPETQLVQDSLPTMGLYVPRAQYVHAPVGPVLPAAHPNTEQTPPSATAYPSLQIQTLLDAVEFEFSGQPVHATEPKGLLSKFE